MKILTALAIALLSSPAANATGFKDWGNCWLADKGTYNPRSYTGSADLGRCRIAFASGGTATLISLTLTNGGVTIKGQCEVTNIGEIRANPKAPIRTQCLVDGKPGGIKWFRGVYAPTDGSDNLIRDVYCAYTAASSVWYCGAPDEGEYRRKRFT